MAKWWPPTPSRQRDGSVTLHPYSPRRRAAAGKLSPALCVFRPRCSGLAGKSLGEVLAQCKKLPHRGSFSYGLGWLCVKRQRQYGRPATGPPLCKGSCRRTPTEGLTASRRTQAVLPVPCRDGQAVLPHPTIENQLNHSLGFAIPPDMAAAPRRHKGGFSLPGRIQPTGAKKNWERRLAASPLQKLEKVA